MNNSFTVRLSSEVFEEVLSLSNPLPILEKIADAFLPGISINSITWEDCADTSSLSAIVQ